LLKALFINMTILISFISAGSQLAKKFKFEEIHSIRAKIIMGLVSGALGSILMLFSVNVTENTIIDFRNIAIIMSAVIGGAIPVFISTILMSLFRVTYFGINLSSLIAVLVATLNSVGCLCIIKCRIKPWKKWAYSTIYILIITTVALYIILGYGRNFLIIIFIYWASNCFVSAITYWYINYSLETIKLFRKLEVESSKDFLTGLNNVRQFDFVLNSAMKNVREKDENLSLLMVDIDYFKKVNDTYGHPEGDLVLIKLGEILYECCRTFDEVSRNGGEEFSVLLLDCPNPQALHIAERIRNRVEMHPFLLSSDKQIAVTVSIGVASYPDTTKDIEKLIEEADKALYAAKRAGRNRVCT